MTTLAGKGLLFGGCVALGILTGLGRLRRVACLEEFRRSLSGLARELTFSLRPLPELAEADLQAIAAAVNEALRKSSDDFSQKMGSITGGLNLGGLM